MAIVNITSNNFGNLVLKSEKPSLVLFWAMGDNRRNYIWDQLLRAVDEDPNSPVNLCKVSVNYAPHVAMRFHVASYPTAVLIRNKDVVGTISGDPTMGAIKDLLAKLEAVAEDSAAAEEDAETTGATGA